MCLFYKYWFTTHNFVVPEHLCVLFFHYIVREETKEDEENDKENEVCLAVYMKSVCKIET